jgi:hypothetical protein
VDRHRQPLTAGTLETSASEPDTDNMLGLHDAPVDTVIGFLAPTSIGSEILLAADEGARTRDR